MQKSSLVGHAVELYALFSRNHNIPADSLVRDFFYKRKYLGSKDRRFIADTFFGAIKNGRRLEAIVTDVFPAKEIPPQLVVAAYLEVFAGEKPDTMKQVLMQLPDTFRREFSLEVLNALCDESREDVRLSSLSPDERLAVYYSFPNFIVKELSADYGLESTEAILKASNEEGPTTLRVNTLIAESREALTRELEGEGCSVTFSNIAADALVLPKRTNVMALKAFKRGAFEMQDEASQLVGPFAHIEKATAKVLDACAGAGGKALHLSALLKNRGEIYATDIDARKLEELKKRVRRSGAQNIRIVRPDQKAQFLGKQKDAWFDVVLLDVPCSGTGTLRRNPGIKWVLSERMLDELVIKQRAILDENKHYVRPGGVLLYATCSLLKREGERQVEWFLEKHSNEFTLEEMLRTRPDQEGCDGFFAARLRKKASASV